MGKQWAAKETLPAPQLCLGLDPESTEFHIIHMCLEEREREGQRFDEFRGAEGAVGIILLGKGHITV